MRRRKSCRPCVLNHFFLVFAFLLAKKKIRYTHHQPPPLHLPGHRPPAAASSQLLLLLHGECDSVLHGLRGLNGPPKHAACGSYKGVVWQLQTANRGWVAGK